MIDTFGNGAHRCLTYTIAICSAFACRYVVMESQIMRPLPLQILLTHGSGLPLSTDLYVV